MKPMLINFKPSITLSALIFLMAFIMGCILIPLDLYWQIKLVIVTLIVVAASYAVCCYGLLLLPWSCVRLEVNVKNQLLLTRRDGRQIADVTVAADSVVTPYLTVVRFYQKNAAILSRVFSLQMIILPDSLDAESYRQLRVWLRWGQPHKHSFN